MIEETKKSTHFTYINETCVSLNPTRFCCLKTWTAGNLRHRSTIVEVDLRNEERIHSLGRAPLPAVAKWRFKGCPTNKHMIILVVTGILGTQHNPNYNLLEWRREFCLYNVVKHSDLWWMILKAFGTLVAYSVRRSWYNIYIYTYIYTVYVFSTCRQVPTICRNWHSSLIRVNHICASTSKISPCQIPTETPLVVMCG